MVDFSDQEDLFDDILVPFNIGIENLLPPTQPSASDVVTGYSPDGNDEDGERVIQRQVECYLSNTVPPNTMKANTYAMNSYHKFAREDPNVPDLWNEIKLSRISYTLIRFVAVKGRFYKPRTFYAILCGLNRVLLSRSNEEFNIFKHSRFAPFRRVFDGYLKEMQATEIIETYKCDIITVIDEDKIEALLGWATPEQLLTSLVYKTTFTWALRGGTALFSLTVNSFSFFDEGNKIRVVYTERQAKNYQPGLKNIHHQRRRVQHYDLKCDKLSFTALFHEYLARCHSSVRDGDSEVKLFQHPLKRSGSNKLPIWFGSKNHLGRNYFNTLMKQLFKDADLPSDYTIKCLRPSAIDKLSEGGIGNPVIRERTGHKTDDALNEYKRPKKVDNIMKTSEMLRSSKAGHLNYVNELIQAILINYKNIVIIILLVVIIFLSMKNQ